MWFAAVGHCLIFAELQALLFFSLSFCKTQNFRGKIPQNYFIQNLQEITKDKTIIILITGKVVDQQEQQRSWANYD